MNVNKKSARTAGILYLIIIIAGIFAEFLVRQSLIVAGDAATTAANIVASEGLFRFGIAGDLIMILSDVALALVLYVLLRPVNRALALLAAFFRLTQAAILGLNLLNLFLALRLLSGASFLSVFAAGQLQAFGLLFLEAHAVGYAVAMVPFALCLFVLAYLVYQSGYFPRILAVLLVLAAAGYLVDSFAQVILTNYASYQEIFSLIVTTPAFIGELAMCLWLLVKGVDVRQVNRVLAPPAERAAV